tara:strand:+ start:3367 stop:3495 length:129 start_codon:yes stop_codon:yes gene_type:complete
MKLGDPEITRIKILSGYWIGRNKGMKTITSSPHSKVTFSDII